MKPIRMFISSVQREFDAERAALRDSTSNGSVQVMLFADRLEVWNPGRLPSSLTLAGLRKPHASVPHNPLLAESLYLAEYIERMGTGTGDMIRRCAEVGLREPQFTVRDGFVLTLWRPSEKSPSGKAGSRPESRPESMEARVLRALEAGALSKAEIARVLGHREISGQLNKTIRLLIAERRIEPTLPDKPNSRLQQYRLTVAGIAYLASLGGGVPSP